jgi:hypothetical protein
MLHGKVYRTLGREECGLKMHIATHLGFSVGCQIFEPVGVCAAVTTLLSNLFPQPKDISIFLGVLPVESIEPGVR